MARKPLRSCPTRAFRPRRSEQTIRAVLLASALLLTGCDSECVGVGCEEVFSGALVGVLFGADQPKRGEHSPLDVNFSLQGELSMGPDWDVALGPDLLLAGSPDDGAVRSYPLTTNSTLESSDADGVIRGESNQDHFGSALVVLPDFDGDGEPDLLVGAPTFTVSQTTRHDGALYLMSGAGTGIFGAKSASEARIRIAGESIGARLGDQVYACGDLDGDGLGDFAASAPWDDAGAPLAGRVVLGLSSLLEPLPSQVLSGAIGPSWVGTDIGAKAGWSVACQDDLNQDGLADLLIGAPFADSDEDEGAGAAYLILGGDDLPSGSLRDAATRIISGERLEDWMGWGIATGDLDGDGITDVAISSPGRSAGLGQVKVWTQGSFMDPDASPSYRITGEIDADGFGRGLSMADVTGDGLDELLVGAPFVNPEQDDTTYDAGKLYVFRGQAGMDDWSKQMTGDQARLRYLAPQQYLRTGQLIRSGDVDGDGLADLALLHRTDPS